MLLLGCLLLAACDIRIDNDEKSGDVKNIHVSIGSLGGLKGNGKQASETRTLKAVKELDVSGALTVLVSIGSTPSLSVSGDENLLPYVVTEQQGERLVIHTQRQLSPREPIKVTVVMPALSYLKHTGSGRLEVAGLAGGDLQLEATGSGETQIGGKVASLSARLVGSGDVTGQQLVADSMDVEVLGSGDVRLGKIETGSLRASIKGSGSVAAEGTTRELKGSVMGSGDLHFKELQARTAELEIMGSGDISAYASESVKADAKGSGDIVVYGKPPRQAFSGKHVSLAEN